MAEAARTPASLPEIISGGQTGVDRAALDAAIRAGHPCGGYCPRGRWAEDGTISTHYPLLELDDADPGARTRANAEDSDALVVVCCGEPAGGTALALATARDKDKPHLLLDLEAMDHAAAGDALRAFLDEHRPRTLNVAGPRASEWPDAYAQTRRIFDALLRSNSAT